MFLDINIIENEIDSSSFFDSDTYDEDNNDVTIYNMKIKMINLHNSVLVRWNMQFNLYKFNFESRNN